MKAYLTYALRGDELVHVKDVPNGKECGCICPHCKHKLCAKNGGESKVHHFAHLSGADCVGAVESALHKMAKDVMKEALCIQLPNGNDGMRGDLLKLDRVEVEFYDKETQLRPDCIGYYGDKVIWIEFKRTHAVDAKKKGKIISKKIDCVELDLNDCSLDPDAVRKFITEDTDKRVWIRNIENKSKHTDAANVYGGLYNTRAERSIRRVFAKDENGTLVNLLDDTFDANQHTYYCLACGKEVTIDVDETGAYCFTHLDQNHCEDNFYLYEAAKTIIQHKFLTSEEYNIVLWQKQQCDAKGTCCIFQPDTCNKSKPFTYNLKEHGYIECLKDCKVPNYSYRCDLVIKRPDNEWKNAIIISVAAGNCHVDIKTNQYKVIEIKVYDNSTLLSLLNGTIKEDYNTSFLNFLMESNHHVPSNDLNRKVLRFSLYSSGKYYLDYVPCTSLESKKSKAVLEHLYVKGSASFDVAKWYSLLKCYERKRKACFCEICMFLRTNNKYGPARPICIRYKTKKTPQFPLDSKLPECEHFKLDKELARTIKLNYEDVHIIEKECEA